MALNVRTHQPVPSRKVAGTFLSRAEAWRWRRTCRQAVLTRGRSRLVAAAGSACARAAGGGKPSAWQRFRPVSPPERGAFSWRSGRACAAVLPSEDAGRRTAPSGRPCAPVAHGRLFTLLHSHPLPCLGVTGLVQTLQERRDTAKGWGPCRAQAQAEGVRRSCPSSPLACDPPRVRWLRSEFVKQN